MGTFTHKKKRIKTLTVETVWFPQTAMLHSSHKEGLLFEMCTAELNLEAELMQGTNK